MVCNLCLKTHTDNIESHIYPKFLYKSLKKTGSVIALSLKDGKETPRGAGEYEIGILCRDCETLLSKYEGEAFKLFNAIETQVGSAGVQVKKVTLPDGLEIYELSNFSYEKFKKFALSLVWRASISSRQAFEKVNIGSQHEEVIRKILNNESLCCEPDQYLVMVMDVGSAAVSESILIPPLRKRILGKTLYVLHVGRFQIFQWISNPAPVIDSQKALLLEKPGNLIVPVIPRDKAEEFFVRHFSGKRTK